jgi:hypothetical protein
MSNRTNIPEKRGDKNSSQTKRRLLIVSSSFSDSENFLDINIFLNEIVSYAVKIFDVFVVCPNSYCSLSDEVFLYRITPNIESLKQIILDKNIEYILPIVGDCVAESACYNIAVLKKFSFLKVLPYPFSICSSQIFSTIPSTNSLKLLQKNTQVKDIKSIYKIVFIDSAHGSNIILITEKCTEYYSNLLTSLSRKEYVNLKNIVTNLSPLINIKGWPICLSVALMQDGDCFLENIDIGCNTFNLAALKISASFDFFIKILLTPDSKQLQEKDCSNYSAQGIYYKIKQKNDYIDYCDKQDSILQDLPFDKRSVLTIESSNSPISGRSVFFKNKILTDNNDFSEVFLNKKKIFFILSRSESAVKSDYLFSEIIRSLRKNQSNLVFIVISDIANLLCCNLADIFYCSSSNYVEIIKSFKDDQNCFVYLDYSYHQKDLYLSLTSNDIKVINLNNKLCELKEKINQNSFFNENASVFDFVIFCDSDSYKIISSAQPLISKNNFISGYFSPPLFLQPYFKDLIYQYINDIFSKISYIGFLNIRFLLHDSQIYINHLSFDCHKVLTSIKSINKLFNYFSHLLLYKYIYPCEQHKQTFPIYRQDNEFYYITSAYSSFYKYSPKLNPPVTDIAFVGQTHNQAYLKFLIAKGIQFQNRGIVLIISNNSKYCLNLAKDFSYFGYDIAVSINLKEYFNEYNFKCESLDSSEIYGILSSHTGQKKNKLFAAIINFEKDDKINDLAKRSHIATAVNIEEANLLVNAISLYKKRWRFKKNILL